MNLQQLFETLLLKIGFDQSKIESLWHDLEKVYSAKSRHYHNLTHLEEMIVLYENYQSELKFPDEVLAMKQCEHEIDGIASDYHSEGSVWTHTCMVYNYLPTNSP